METIFTKIINREIPASIVYEDDDHLAFLDISPIEKGHTLVIPKKHATTIMDMSEEEYLELQKVVLKIAKHYEQVLGCGINILQNNKAISGQEVMHVHFHIVPRREEKQIYNMNCHDKYLDNEMENYKKQLEVKN